MRIIRELRCAHLAETSAGKMRASIRRHSCAKTTCANPADMTNSGAASAEATAGKSAAMETATAKAPAPATAGKRGTRRSKHHETNKAKNYFCFHASKLRLRAIALPRCVRCIFFCLERGTEACFLR